MKRTDTEAGVTATDDDNAGLSSRILVVFAASVAVVLMLLMIQVMPVPNSTRLYRSLVDFGHAPVFVAIAFASLQVSHAARGFAGNHCDRWDYIIAAGAVVALAFLSELAQVNESGRSASMLDVLRDIAGGALCLSLYGISRRPPLLQRRSHRRFIATMCAALIVFLVAPVAWTIAAYVNRDAKWPTILTTESGLDRVLLHPFEAEIRIVQSTDLDDSEKDVSGVHVTASRLVESGLTIEDIASEWREYQNICADITNLYGLPIRARIRLGDAPNIFRSENFRMLDLHYAAQSRVTTCGAIAARPTGSSVSSRIHTGYGSLALTVPAAENVLEFIVHRIWLE